MRFAILWNLLTKSRLRALFALNRSCKELYRLCFLERARQLGILHHLAGGPASLESLAALHATAPDRIPALKALLDLGEGLGELGATGGRYRLKGFLARELVRKDNDPLLALLIEAAGLHIPCIMTAPGDHKEAAALSELTTSLSEVIARSSRAMEPLLEVVATSLVPGHGPVRLLEIGCGSGVYVRAALRRNAQLHATAIEREPDVARAAVRAIEAEGFTGRFEMVNADIRSLSFDSRFDLITLYNNIYYFPGEDRPALLATLHSWLAPGGRLAITTLCPGGSHFSRIMMLWSTAAAGAGSLPEPEAFVRLLGQAGFTGVRAQNLLAGETYSLFTARKE